MISQSQKINHSSNFNWKDYMHIVSGEDDPMDFLIAMEKAAKYRPNDRGGEAVVTDMCVKPDDNGESTVFMERLRSLCRHKMAAVA